MGAAAQHEGWLFLEPDAVPESWRARAVYVALVPLLPEEAAQVLADEPARDRSKPEDRDLMRLLAAGTSAAGIARKIGIPVRSVHRRIARLRQAFEVDATAELVARLARAGFGGGTSLPLLDAGSESSPVEHEREEGADDDPKE